MPKEICKNYSRVLKKMNLIIGFRKEAADMPNIDIRNIVQTNQLTKIIDGRTLVKNVNIHMKKGEIYGFLGPNGAGKTTVMKMLTNLWKPTLGEVRLFGEKLTPASYEVQKRMGSLSVYIQLLLKSFVIVSMSFIALFIGMKMKSSKAAIIASFILIFLTQANIGDFSLAGNMVFPVILTVVSFLFAVLSVLNAETKDLL